MQVGAIILSRCIEAEQNHRLLAKEYETERELIISGHYPSYRTDFGMLMRERISTENAAIRLVELEEKIKKSMVPLKKKRMLLKKALRILTEKELAVFNYLVWGEGHNYSINDEELSELNITIESKLCKYLSTKESELLEAR